MQNNIVGTMRQFKIMDYGSSFYPFNQAGSSGTGPGGGSIGEKFLERIHDHLRVNSFRSRSSQPIQNLQVDNNMLAQGLSIYGLPQKDLIEPHIEPYLKSVNFIESLADVYGRVESCPESEKSRVYVEQCALLQGLHDPNLCKRSLKLARQHAFDVHSKVVLSAALKYERREEELLGISSMECSGKYLDCPKSTLIPGYSPEFVNDGCGCHRTLREEDEVECSVDEEECSISEEECDMSFWIGSEEVRCNRYYMSSLSRPFKAMLYGGFMESKREKINFTYNEISGKGMKAAVIYSRTKSVDSFDLQVVLELLSLANKFCCDEMKSSCDAFLADKVVDMETAMLLIEYGLEETSYLLVAACLQVILRELPSSLNSPSVLKLFCSPEARERLALVGHASFDLYNLLRHVAMDEDMKANATVMLLERLGECAAEGWQKQLAFHLLGCVMMERKEFKDAQKWFKIAVEAGHTYSSVGVARTKHKRGHTYTAYKLMNSLISNCTPSGWMYQERSLYCNGKEKMMDLNTATELDPTLSFPYKYRAVLLMEENKTAAGITEIEKLINFKVSPDCLELRAWFLISQEDYEGALRDVRAIVTLDSNYMMFHGKLDGNHLIQLLGQHVQQFNQADCWIELYDRWSAVDDIGSLAVVHHMLSNDPGKSLLLFRQSLLLVRLNCNMAAMRSLRMARNRAATDHERLVYEGWILYDTGHWDEALAKAEEAITMKRSFEAFFLKAYALSDPDSSLDSANATYVVQLLEDALRCPSDGLRKGQALSNLGAIYVDSGRLDLAADCYMTALDIKHSRAHVGLARVYHLKNQRKAAYDEMTKLIEKSKYNASAYEKRSEYCERDMAQSDLSMATKLDPLRTYPYRYRAAIFMDDHKEAEAIAELTKAIAFKTDLQLLHLRATFHDSMGDNTSTIRDCEAALCLHPNHKDTLELYHKAQKQAKEEQT
ncbi:Ethylene-overproduction protein 1 [Heracleum sosnowskyi]|uniref:Ethylene-overproduction protein 1 n=1 Tax=Heracleum sosnowskyi TaxID=360622 RepID=A0AAD8HFS3_9APIA|nr:Ethylene-overproduction protein 1 [Heracleum sosnowskyi]